MGAQPPRSTHIKSSAASDVYKRQPTGDSVSSMTFATSGLTESVPIEVDKEVPLVVQIATTKNEIRSYDVKYFEIPR